MEKKNRNIKYSGKKKNANKHLFFLKLKCIFSSYIQMASLYNGFCAYKKTTQKTISYQCAHNFYNQFTFANIKKKNTEKNNDEKESIKSGHQQIFFFIQQKTQ